MAGAHLVPREGYDTLENRDVVDENTLALHYRDLFWLCWTVDADIAARTGRPPSINSSFCDLTLPKWYTSQSVMVQASWRYPGDLRLSFIKAEAYNRLYAPSALLKSDAELLRSIRELDDMLEAWRTSFPEEIRPPLAYHQDSRYTSRIHVRWFILCLEYHHCMSAIHQASSRCKTWSGDGDIQEGVSSSLDLALQASRSILLYFRHGEQHLLPHIFWIIVFYPLSAVLALFCNIIACSPGGDAEGDVMILEEALAEVRAKYDERHADMPVAQARHLRLLCEFLAEVVVLARTVIEEGGESQEQRRLLHELAIA